MSQLILNGKWSVFLYLFSALLHQHVPSALVTTSMLSVVVLPLQLLETKGCARKG